MGVETIDYVIIYPIFSNDLRCMWQKWLTERIINPFVQDRAWLNEVLGEMAVPHSNNNDLESVNSAEVKAKTAAVKGITSVLSGLVDLIKDEQKPHILDAIKNELQHIADDGELLDRADGIANLINNFSFRVGSLWHQATLSAEDSTLVPIRYYLRNYI